MAKADLALGAGGATSWERLCLGLPTLVVTVADNQRPIADALNKMGLIRWLGHRNEVDELALSQGIGNLIQEGLDKDWSQRCRAAIDGKGVDQVRTALMATAGMPLQVRLAKVEDETLLLDWVNDPVTRRNAFSPELIAEATHRDWFRARLRDLESCHLYIVETEEGIPVGQVRFDRMDEEWTIDYALAAHFRGRGLGRRVMEVALRKLREDEPGVSVLGQVKATNQPSCRVFESLGFNAQTIEGKVEYRLVL